MDTPIQRDHASAFSNYEDQIRAKKEELKQLKKQQKAHLAALRNYMQHEDLEEMDAGDYTILRSQQCKVSYSKKRVAEFLGDRQAQYEEENTVESIRFKIT